MNGGTGQCGCGEGSACKGSGGGADVHECVAAAHSLLERAEAFVELVGDRGYSRACALASDGTIGRHVRHLLDHYAAVLGAADSAAPLIDYDHRDRDVPTEVSPAAARAAIRAVRAGLARVTAETMASPVTVRAMIDADGRTVDLASSFGRELAFATHHAMHHHAMMKFIADSFGLATPEGFGQAPSTINHERRGSATLMH